MRSRFNTGEIQESDVHCLNIDKGEFTVWSSDRGLKVEHTIQLLTPSCTCQEWRKTHFPCKHFYAVFNAYDEGDFCCLPHSYLTNVFITLDYIGFTAPEESDPMETLHSKRKMNTEDDDDDDNNIVLEEVSQYGDDDWPGEDCSGDHDSTSNEKCCEREPCEDQSQGQGSSIKSANVEKLRKSVLEKISLVRDAAYNVEDPDCLQEALKNLAQVHSSLLSKIPNEGGLRMRTSPAKKRLRVTTMDNHKVFHKKLPLRRKTKTLKSRKNIDSKSTTTIIINSSLESSPEKVRIKLEIAY